MRVLIAPGNFKGSLSALQAARIIEAGLRKTAPRTMATVLPLCDGGMGTAALMTGRLAGRLIFKSVTGPMGRPVKAGFGLASEPARPGPTCVIEMAQAAGLVLVPPDRLDPWRTTTRGVGELMRDALRQGCARVIVGCGDSATIDCGMGALSAIGVRFLDRHGRPVPSGARGLDRLYRIDRSGLMAQASRAEWIAACDVDNRLTGPGGALMYGRQKGAGARDRERLDRGLRNFRRIVLEQFGVDPDGSPGSGAAGGLAAGLVALLAAKIVSGFDLYRTMVRLDRKIANCDVVMTGEGRLDEQTFRGKAAFRLAGLALQWGKPVVFITGSLAKSGALKSFCRAHTVVTLQEPRMTVREAMARAPQLLLRKAMLLGQTRLSFSE